MNSVRRIAVIADIHGELLSLDAVLADIALLNIEHIVCLGDVSGLGPNPHEVLIRLRELNCPVVMGNADQFVLEPDRLIPENNPGVDDLVRRLHDMERWGLQQLTDEDIDYVRIFEPVIELPLDQDRTMLCYHGSPRSAWEEIRGSTPEVELQDKLGDRRTAIMVGGHTHEQFVRRLGDSIVMNPGSVGLPWEDRPDGTGRNPPWAEYAVVSDGEGRLSIDLRRVPVDATAIRRALLESGIPHADAWAADRY